MRPLATILCLGATACWGRDIPYEGGTSEDTAPPAVTECGDESTYGDGWRVEGTAVFRDSGEPATEGLCISVIDPTPAITSGEPELLASSTVCADGAFVVAGIQENPAIGVFVVIDDCEGSTEDLVMTSATGIGPDEVGPLAAGDALEGKTAYVVTQDYRDTYIADLQAAGYDGPTDETFRFLAGAVLGADGQPVDDHTVSCGACAYPTFYGDADPSDGLFSAGGTANASTATDAGAFFLVPEAAIGQYKCLDPSGETLFTNTYGSLPGYGVFIEIDCTP